MRNQHTRAGIQMLEYIFFHEKPYQIFMDWLKQKGVVAEGSISDEGYEITIPEDMDDELGDDIDEKYDQLLDYNQELIAEGKGARDEDYQMSAVLIELKDGRTTYADIDAKLLGRIMGVLSPQEFSTVVEAIVEAVEDPQERSYCQRLRD